MVTEAAPGLRAAGILKLTVGDVSFEIEAPIPADAGIRRLIVDDDSDFLDPTRFRRIEQPDTGDDA